jgi:hypothetical protein
VAALDAASGSAVAEDADSAATRQSSAGAAPGNGRAACQYCGKADLPLRGFETVADGRLVGSVTLHPRCKDAWVHDLWAAHRARQAGTAPDRGGG